MATPNRAQEMREAHHTSPLNSAKVVNNNTNISLNGGGGGGGGVIRYPTTSNNGGDAMEIPMTPLTPRTISRSEPDPYPTTFVQADTSSFKQVVQILTGSSETVTKQQQQLKQSHPSDPPVSGLPAPPSSKSTIPPIRTTPKRSQQQQQQQGFKLYERRNHSHLKNSLIINTLIPSLGVAVAGGFSPRNKKPEILSPSMLDFPKLTLSPVTPLVDPFNNSSSGSGSSPSLGSSSSSSSSEEERAIAQKGFYLHPSPMNTPRGTEPQLLPLFPVTSPRISGASS